MLKLSLHASSPRGVSPQNRIGSLDVAYETLAARADYKAVMWTAGLGEQAPVQLQNYPRWSASIWDLLARIVCLATTRKEAIWPEDIPHRRSGPYIRDLTALVEHWPDGLDTRRATVGKAHVQMCSRRRHYQAVFEDDILGRQASPVFTHTPVVLNAWDLLARAYGWATTGGPELPPRPELYKPIPVPAGKDSFVILDTLSEPARTGCYRWLRKRNIETVEIPAIKGPCVTEAQFVTFLQKAV
jgi:hypothetical protein